MSLDKIKVVYTTTDGQTFDNQRDAINHQDKIDNVVLQVAFHLIVPMTINIRDIAEDCKDFIEDNFGNPENEPVLDSDWKEDIDDLIKDRIEVFLNDWSNIEIEYLQDFDTEYKLRIEQISREVIKKLFEEKVLQ